MPGLQDLLLLRQLQDQADPVRSAFQSLADGVSRGIEEAREAQKQKKATEEKNADTLKQWETMNTAGGKLIPKLSLKEDGTYSITASTPSTSEIKSQYELDTEKKFIEDIQGGVDGRELRLKYPTKSSDIDQLEKAGTVKNVNVPSLSLDAVPNLTGGGISTEEGKYVVSGFDELGRPKGWERTDDSETEKKRKLEVSELDSFVKSLSDSFALANKEAKSVENQGKRGMEGRIAGKISTIKGIVGDSPAVNVYRMRSKAFATTVAKAAGEVRPTDEDIRRFMGTLMSTELSDEENTLLLNGLIEDLHSRGAKAVWAERIGGYSGNAKSIKYGDYIIEVE